MASFFIYKTPIGKILIGEDRDSITHISFQDQSQPEGYERLETKLLMEANAQLQAYFEGRLQEFSLPLRPEGTDFMKKVWKALCEISYGKTRSYKDIALAIGRDRAYRAVGMANNKNPISILIPCHRVIGANGKLVGYGGGLHIKKHLLRLENPDIRYN